MTTKKPKDITQAGETARLKLYENYLKRIASGKILSAADQKAFKALESDINNTTDGPKPGDMLTYTEALEYLEISERVMSYHVTRGNIKQNPDSSFEASELNRWREKYRDKENNKSKHKTIREKKDLADLRWKDIRAKREKVLYEQLRGNLYEKAIVDTALEEIIQVTKRAFQLIPDHASAAMVGHGPEGQREVLQGLVDEILTGLSERATIDEIQKRIAIEI